MERPTLRRGSGYGGTARWALIALVASVLVYGAITRAMWLWTAVGTAVFVGLFLPVGDLAVGAIFGVLCPACGRWGLIPVRAVAFGHRNYRCDACGARVKRRPLGGWRDASTPHDDYRYRPRPSAGGWAGAPEAADLAQGGTAGTLLANHRQRVAEAPPGDSRVPSAD